MRFWKTRNLLSLFLYPLSVIFVLVVFFRKKFYQFGIFNQTHFNVPVIIIGNINVGGTGKTPFLIHCAERLTQLGYRVGIISRGYKATDVRLKKGQSILLENHHLASQMGDEACLIRYKTQLPIVVGHSRVKSVQLLLNTYELDIILSDDGLQHYALHRDYEIALVDQNQGFGNGFMLPAGPLREPVSRLKNTDLIVHHVADFNDSSDVQMRIQINHAYQLTQPDNQCDLVEFKNNNKTIFAVAGIGQPERFFNQLKSLGLNITGHAFDDHHQFCKQDFDFARGEKVFLTEKDAIKCLDFGLDNLWVVPIELAVLNFDTEDLIKRLALPIKEIRE